MGILKSGFRNLYYYILWRLVWRFIDPFMDKICVDRVFWYFFFDIVVVYKPAFKGSKILSYVPAYYTHSPSRLKITHTQSL